MNGLASLTSSMLMMFTPVRLAASVKRKFLATLFTILALLAQLTVQVQYKQNSITLSLRLVNLSLNSPIVATVKKKGLSNSSYTCRIHLDVDRNKGRVRKQDCINYDKMMRYPIPSLEWCCRDYADECHKTGIGIYLRIGKCTYRDIYLCIRDKSVSSMCDSSR